MQKEVSLCSWGLLQQASRRSWGHTASSPRGHCGAVCHMGTPKRHNVLGPMASSSFCPLRSLQDRHVGRLSLSAEPPSWGKLGRNWDRMKNNVSHFVNKCDKRKITTQLCVAITQIKSFLQRESGGAEWFFFTFFCDSSSLRRRPLGFLDTWLSIKQLICEARHLKQEGKIAYQVNQLWPWAATGLNINIFKGSLNMRDSRDRDIVSSHAALSREEKWGMDAARGSLHRASRLWPAWMPNVVLIVLSPSMALGSWGFIRFLFYFILSCSTVFYTVIVSSSLVLWYRKVHQCYFTQLHEHSSWSFKQNSKYQWIPNRIARFSRIGSFPQKLEVSFVPQFPFQKAEIIILVSFVFFEVYSQRTPYPFVHVQLIRIITSCIFSFLLSFVTQACLVAVLAWGKKVK